MPWFFLSSFFGVGVFVCVLFVCLLVCCLFVVCLLVCLFVWEEGPRFSVVWRCFGLLLGLSSMLFLLGFVFALGFYIIVF